MVQLADDIEAVLAVRRWARLSVQLLIVEQFERSTDANKPGRLLADAGQSTPKPQRRKLSRTNALRRFLLKCNPW